MIDEVKKNIQNWWAQHPMTYGETHGQPFYKQGNFALGTPEFFNQIDQEFYSWNHPLHQFKPFDKLFPFDQYKNKNVLEIGCGMGTMLMNWAKNGAYCTAVDLNQTSIEQTKKRFEQQHLKAHLHLEDAHHLPFENHSFDYVWSWGVLHHSPHLELSIKEFFRVLKPGGGFGLMLYNRHSFYQWYMTNYVEGFLHEESKFLDDLQLNSRYGDGHREEGNPYTWPITKQEGLKLISPFTKDANVRILGTDLDCILRLILPGMSAYVPKCIVKSLARRWGWSLWFYGTKNS